LKLLDDLRQREAEADRELGVVIALHHGDATGSEGSYWNGKREGFKIAADLLESDPDSTLRKRLQDLLREVERDRPEDLDPTMLNAAGEVLLVQNWVARRIHAVLDGRE
jgi:hypothetical protein